MLPIFSAIVPSRPPAFMPSWTCLHWPKSPCLARRSAMTASDTQCRLEVYLELRRSLCAETVAAVHTSRRSIVAHAISNRPGLDCGRHALWTCRTKSTLDSRTWLSAAPESRLSWWSAIVSSYPSRRMLSSCLAADGLCRTRCCIGLSRCCIGLSRG